MGAFQQNTTFSQKLRVFFQTSENLKFKMCFSAMRSESGKLKQRKANLTIVNDNTKLKLAGKVFGLWRELYYFY